MRLRIQTEPPLPPVKAWFAFDENDTIGALKKSICNNVPALKALKTGADSTRLELDGFELLDSLSFGGVVKEGDLVVVKQVGSAGKKRKAEADVEVASKKKKYSHAPSSSSSSESDSSSSNSSSDSSSDSESDSDSSSSPSSSPPTALPIYKKQAAQQLLDTHNHTPPGQGTHQTRSRNLRRRLKKKYESAAATGQSLPVPAPPPKRASTANTQPIGREAADLSLSMFSLGNKNKKKGYKQALIRPESSKIIFESDNKAIPTASVIEEQPSYRLIPPSEREDLPRNMFVTSVDVEDGLWDKKRNRRRRSEPTEQRQAEEEAVEELLEGTESALTLDYGDAAPKTSTDETTWSHIERTFDSYEAPPRTLDSSHIGGLLAWKELSLNAMTFSPEIMLQIARIVAVSPTTYSIQKLVRPGWEQDDDEEGGPLVEEFAFDALPIAEGKYIKPSS